MLYSSGNCVPVQSQGCVPCASETQQQIVLELPRYLSYGNHTSNQTCKKPEALGILDIPEKLGEVFIYLSSGFAISDMSGKWVSGKKSRRPALENMIYLKAVALQFLCPNEETKQVQETNRVKSTAIK